MGLDDIDLTDLALLRRRVPRRRVHPPAPRGAGVVARAHEPHPRRRRASGSISRHAEMQAIGADADTFSSERAPGAPGGGHPDRGPALRVRRRGAAQHDGRPPPSPHPASDHPGGGAAGAGAARRRAAGPHAAILDAVAARGRCDFLVDVAVELPLQAIAMLMGVPDEDRHDLMAWTNATLTYDDRELGARSAGSEQAAAAMAAYGTALIERKRPPRAATTSWPPWPRATVEDDDGERREPLSDLELLMFFNLLIAAGSETTRNAIALGMAALIEHPEQWDLLRRRPVGVADGGGGDPAVVEPDALQPAHRHPRRGGGRGRRSAAGDKVTLWWASANRDEDVFDDPFALRRPPQPQPPPGLRLPEPLLPGGQPGPPRDPHHARGAPGPLRAAVARRAHRAVPHQQARRGQAHVRDVIMD